MKTETEKYFTTAVKGVDMKPKKRKRPKKTSMNRRHAAHDAKSKARAGDETKHEIHPKDCAVWVRMYERPDRYSADFFDQNDQFMFTVDVPKEVVKREEISISNHFEVLARFYDENVWRRRIS